jgi:drug/metabolite transporter (DMT)-like permease
MMKIFLPLLFALIAAVGNAMFALGQKRSAGTENGLAFVGVSALIATVLALSIAPFLGPMGLSAMVRAQARNLLLAGAGLFLTYLGFHLLYSHFGVSPYILYAVLSILTTTVVVGIVWLKEPVNGYRMGSIALALASVALYSLSQLSPRH